MRILILVGLLGLSACHSGWNQDPFSNQEENVKNAVPPGGNKVLVPPIQDVMRIDVKESHVIKEGQSLSLNIDYRELHPEFTFKGMLIRNLEAELPGATYDPQTRELVFAPEEGYVLGGFVESRVVRVTMLAEYQDLIHERRKDIVFHIVKSSTEAPSIEKIEDLEASYKEGERKNFQIYVRDEVSPDGPILVVGNYSPSTNNGAHLIEYDKKGKKVFGDPSLWRFNATVDLSAANMADITNSSDLFRVDLQAFSSQGVPAKIKDFLFYVYTKANKPEFFMDKEEIEFQVGQSNQYSFLIVDTGEEGEMSASFTKGCPADASCRCESGSGLKKYIARCEVKWTPTQVGRQSLFVQATNTVLSYDKNNMNQQSKTESFVIQAVNGERL